MRNRELYMAYVRGPYRYYNDKVYKRTVRPSMLSFSVLTFLTGGCYLLYRKCYAEAAIIFGILFLAALLPLTVSAGAVVAVVSILAAILFYPIYRRHIKTRIYKYRAMGMDNEQIRQELIRTGGTNLIAGITSGFLVGSTLIWQAWYYSYGMYHM